MILIIIILVLTSVVQAGGNGAGFNEQTEIFWENCFRTPFLQSDEKTGKRLVDDFWTYGGNCVVHENFIRLTPDRQSKRGWVYNTKPINSPDWSALMRFRVSGKGKLLFGDGVALWYEKNKANQYQPGYLMGHTDEFVGFGIIFDTFKNSEPGHVHKDISLVVNNGKDKTFLEDSNRPGCDVDFRYWEGRDDFSVDAESKVKITLQGIRLKVEIDPYGHDDFEDCFEVNLKGFARDFKHQAHFAISASTGALADNHDLLEFTVAHPSQLDSIKEKETVEQSRPSVEIDTTADDLTPRSLALHVNDLAYEVKDMEDRVNLLDHTIEHSIQTVKTEIIKMVNSLEDQEKKLEERVLEVENRQSDRFIQEVEHRLKKLENELKSNVDRRLKALEHNLKAKVKEAKDSGSSYFYPLLFTILIVCCIFGYLMLDMRKLKNRDKLF